MLRQVIEKKAKEIDEILGLHDTHIEAIRHLVKTSYGIKNLTIDFHFGQKPRILVLNVLDNNGKKVIFKPKRPELLGKILEYLQLSDIQMYFWGMNGNENHTTQERIEPAQ